MKVRPINFEDLKAALRQVKASVSSQVPYIIFFMYQGTVAFLYARYSFLLISNKYGIGRGGSSAVMLLYRTGRGSASAIRPKKFEIFRPPPPKMARVMDLPPSKPLRTAPYKQQVPTSIVMGYPIILSRVPVEMTGRKSNPGLAGALTT
jgi:hypothetical protein